MSCRAALTIGLAFGASGFAQAEAPLTGERILRQALGNESRQNALREQYLYHEHVESGLFNGDGSPGKPKSTWDYEIVYLEGAPYRKLTGFNGKPLNPKQAAYEEEKMQKTAAERRADQAQQKRKIVAIGVHMADVVRLMDHTLLREDEIGGRKVWVVDSKPARDAVAASADDAKVLCYHYTYWIDQEDRVVAQVEYEVIRAGVDSEPGTRSRTVLAKENGSPWFRRSMNGDFLLKGPHGTNHVFERHRYSGFRKFDAQSDIQFAAPPAPAQPAGPFELQ